MMCSDVIMMAKFNFLIYVIKCEGGVTSMDTFLRKFFPEIHIRMQNDNKISNYCKYDSQLLTLFTSSLYIAGFIAAIFASSVTRVFGRRPSIFIGGASFLTGAALGGAALNIYMLVIGRALLGIGVGFTNQSVPLYLSEMAPSRYRGGINTGFQLFVVIGILMANLVNFGSDKIKGDLGWRISLSIAAVPASIITLGAFFLSETPNSLIQRNKDHHKAKLMLQQVRGVIEVDAELNDLIKANDISKAVKDPFGQLLERKYRPQLVMAIAIPCFQQVTGINAIGFYAPILFRTLGFGESVSLLSSVLTAVVVGTTTFISMLVVDKFGRRSLFMVGGVQMLVSQVIIGGLMKAHVGNHNIVSNRHGCAILALICVYVAGFGWSWGPLAWLVPSEIFPLEIRSAGQSITVAVNFLLTFIIAQTFLPMLCHFKSGIFFFFGGWVTIMTLFVYLFLPETKNLPMEKMDQIWKEHWYWKRIVGESTESNMYDT
ncbi:Hexose carrier protein hex6 [Thalictrum thalictroides]|uniref:Hexose carrier protein hex6 n=1 Tax=Thalictrum thalictroides TaxID=46969 RepID=A0A7J6WPV2_THATH|nr:Hexose carrier protein hex6 [Thalictrum thalictroides]